MKKNNYLTIIDFGSSKIRLGVFNKKFDYLFTSSKKIMDKDDDHEVSELINVLIKDAEKKISNHINEVILLNDDAKMNSIDLCLKKKFDQKSSISQNFSSIILEARQLIINNYLNDKILHIIENKYVIDGKEYFQKIEKDLYFREIIIDLKFICIPKYKYSKIIGNLHKNNLNISNFFLSSYIKSFFYLKSFNENKTVAFLDIGWEKSILNYFVNDKILFVKSIPIGGNHITKDISKVLNLKLNESEKIKTAFNETEFEFSYEENENDEKNKLLKKIIDKNISIDLLKKVVLSRIEEIIELVFNDVNLLNDLKKSENSLLVLTGNGSKLFSKNSFHLDSKYNFNEISFYQESDLEICKAGLNFEIYYNEKGIKDLRKTNKTGFFEKFFNFFGS